ncbi:PQQ-dependent sugar dehydrogenase [Sphingomonas lacunae]|uniref:PQQ-dependent sugar dehydrogenase n=1 Tax=Sphingomonas lacunae TaxID=2698828 RepID=A0A6M4ART8_9SPHN|nr:PQQ-dependent sugar dehydrogenase [Sphingomonas lacunae]QJQ31767.1 PQQ-dependent sugar dehydrogenase [Sphingomonas lacunae]
MSLRFALFAPLGLAAASLAVTACQAQQPSAAALADSANAGPFEAAALADAPFTLEQRGDFEDPWAMTFLPDGQSALVTEQAGRLILWRLDGSTVEVSGIPPVSYAGQGGLGDVVLHPQFASNRLVYLSWAEEGEGGKGAVVARARLSLDLAAPALEGLEIIWRQSPKVDGNGHFGHRMAFGPDGMLYIASGERQKFTPAQDMAQNLGKVVRLTDAGAVPSDNPFAAQGGVTAQIWSLGHRNPLGIAFDADGRLWEMEMGPAGGDELNIATRGGNYGYPTVSNGDHYDGRDIPDHSAGDGFVAPRLWWNPAISPGGLLIYRGATFAAWRGDAFIPALSGTGLVHVDLDGENARQANRWNLEFRVRAIAEDPSGGLWLLEDGSRNGQGRLYRMVPRG